MRKFFRAMIADIRAEIDEAVFVLPVLLLVTFGLVNLSMVGFAGLSASNAANYGARMASVAQANQASVAFGAANSMLESAPVGTYTVSVAGGGTPGGLVRVQVQYSVPNYFASLASIFGISTPANWTGTVRSDFRQEGW